MTALEDVVKPGQLWQHVNGSLYEILYTAYMESDISRVVVYRSAIEGENPFVWVRPAAGFLKRFKLAEELRDTPEESVHRAMARQGW